MFFVKNSMSSVFGAAWAARAEELATMSRRAPESAKCGIVIGGTREL
jgi:hypothetical protein